MKELEVEGQAPSPEHQFWRQAIREIRKDSVKTVEDAARQLIGLVTLLSGLYFHAITFGQAPQGYPDVKVLFVGPLALWVLCLLAASLVLFPRRFLLSPYDPDETERLIGQALTYKYRLLRVALGLLVISLGWLVVAAWVYLDIYVPS
ncbi:MAG TPA: hypothetical protein VGD99_05035 [Anaerolineae bacterium]|jgi:hypothetical protein